MQLANQPMTVDPGIGVPEKREVRIAYIPLTDCASVIMASVLKFDQQYGIKIIPVKETSWAALRDGLLSGAHDAAHALYGLIYGLHLGIGGPRMAMNVLMALNHNGQAITLSHELKARGVTDGASLARLIASGERHLTLAQTFPTGTHAMWLYYWLAAQGINPLTDVRVITVPAQQMVSSMRAGRMDGFCAGEPWNNGAVEAGIGFTVATSQDIWPNHPEKVLGVTAQFACDHPGTARAMMAAILAASRWIEASTDHLEQTAEILSAQGYVDAEPRVIRDRLLGHYSNGLGRDWVDAHPLRFFADGAVNFPYLSDGMWFLTQYRRWGLLDRDPDYLAVAGAINRVDLYREVAASLHLPLPASPMRAQHLIDGVLWDGRHPREYAAGFTVRVAAPALEATR